MQFGLTEEQRLFDDSLRAFSRSPADRGAAETRPERQGLRSGDLAGTVELGLPGLRWRRATAAQGSACSTRRWPPRRWVTRRRPPLRGQRGDGAARLGQRRQPRSAGRVFAEHRRGRDARCLGFAGIGGQTGEAVLSLQGKRLSGHVHGALDAGGRRIFWFICRRQAGAGRGRRERRLRAVCRERRPHAPGDGSGVRWRGTVVLDAANDPMAAALRVLDAGRVMLAADTLGAAQYMLDQAVA